MGKQTATNGSRPRHVPQRTCIACRRVDLKRGLVRLVRTPEGQVEVDLTGKSHGRGAYLCHDSACWEAALKRHGLERALRLEQLTDENRERLLTFMRSLRLDAEEKDLSHEQLA